MTLTSPINGNCPDASVTREAHSAEQTGIDGSPKRVLIYGINYSPEPIGVGRYTGDLGAYLARCGHEVDVITAVPHYPGWALRDGYRNAYRRENLSGAHVIRSPLILRDDMYGIWRLMAPLSFALTSTPIAIWKILKDRPDTVLCVEPTLFSAPVALLAGKLVGAYSVLHVQDLEIDAAFAVGHLSGGLLANIARWLEKAVLRRFDAVVTISNRMRDCLMAKGVAADRLSVVRNWVDLDKIRPLSGRSCFRDELSLSDDDFVVLYSGNIGPKQALPVLLEVAMQFVAEQRIVFVIAGEGPEKQRLIDGYGHLANVRFLPLQPEERLCELLNFADLHILPQQKGTADMVLPSKLGGMLASGKPCIVMADEGTEMHDFLSGAVIFVRQGDVTSLCDAIVNTIDRPDDQRARRWEIVKSLTAEKNLADLSRTILNFERSAMVDRIQ